MSGCVGLVILPGKQAAECGLDAEDGQGAVAHIDALNVFRLADAGDAQGVGAVAADVLKRGVLLAVGEVHEGAHVDFRQVHARCGVPDADQLVRLRVVQRLEKHAIDHAEDNGVGADAHGQGDQGDRRK